LDVALMPCAALGVTAADAAEGALVPRAFVAVTVNVYAVPLVSPLIVAVVPDTVTAGRPEGVTV
jgi:hypothetical protein